MLTTSLNVDDPPIATPAQHDAANAALGFRFIRALAVEKAVFDPRLKPKDIRTLAALSYFMNSQTMRAWPSYERISEITGYTHEAIERGIKNLIACGYIFRERRAPITGGRALVHYGLRAVSFQDIDDIIAAAVAQIRANTESGKSGRSRLTPPKKQGPESDLTPPERAEWNADPNQLTPSDPAQLSPQEPYTEEPTNKKIQARRVASIDIEERSLDEFARLYTVWGNERGIALASIDREHTDRQLVGELSIHHLVDPTVLRQAFLAALNTIVAKSHENATSDHRPGSVGGGSAMLSYFRKCLRSEIGNVQLSMATLTAEARAEQYAQEARLAQRVRAIQRPPTTFRGRPSTADCAAQAFAVSEE